MEEKHQKYKPLSIGDLEARIPLIQGGMGVGVSLDRLAGAVAAAGGIGVISTAQIGFQSPGFEKDPIGTNLRAISEYVNKAREKADGGIIGVNIMVATKHYEQYVSAAVQAGVDLIISGAGLPIHLPDLVKDTAVKIAPIVSTVKAASVILKMWDRKQKRVPDLVVIEGPKAGGHLGFHREELEHIEEMNYDQEILGIIEEISSYEKRYGRDIPVVIAGGIYDRNEVKRCMNLGADGVQVATRFVTTEECDASEEYKKMYLTCKKEDIILVNSPVGMPGRAIRNSFIERASHGEFRPKRCYNCISTCDPAVTPYCITDALVRAVTGDVENGLLFCGAEAYRAEKIETVREVIRDLMG